VYQDNAGAHSAVSRQERDAGGGSKVSKDWGRVSKGRGSKGRRIKGKGSKGRGRGGSLGAEQEDLGHRAGRFLGPSVVAPLAPRHTTGSTQAAPTGRPGAASA